MKVERLAEVETMDIQIGDKIHVDHYTATCQEITPKGALFLMDQYLDDPMPMNKKNTNKGGYEESDLRRALQSEDVLKLFSGIRKWMVPFDNGDLLRIPFAGEIFGDKLPKWCEPDDHKQWPLMRDRLNRLASRYDDCECGWLQNKDKTFSAYFCAVASNGLIVAGTNSDVLGIRPAFLIAIYREEAETGHS